MINIPGRFKQSLDLYAAHGAPPGSFLRSVLANDLADSIGWADEEGIMFIKEIVQYVYNELPAACWGNYETVDKWKGIKNDSK